MTRPRFLCVLGHRTGGVLAPAWPGPGRTVAGSPPEGSWVAWRLLGSNHREVARSASVFPDMEACLRDVTRLRTVVGGGDFECVVDAVGGLWGWVVTSAGTPLAVASRLYQRQRECDYSYNVFLAAVPAAAVVMDLPGARGRQPSRAVVASE
ncbi:MAG: hypothetical protein JO222_11040 [Frankiales bacterium]|nr:hypothetical protein [Frankiales bacterium]